MSKDVKDLEAQIKRLEDEGQSLEGDNQQLIFMLEESRREKERIKDNMKEYLDQSREIQRKEEDILRYRINEQEHLARVFYRLL